MEQFRIYETLEAGAIPVLARDSGDLETHVPPEYLESPMLILDDWEDALETMAALTQNATVLDKRQADMQRWYHDFMTAKAQEIEEVLVSKAAQNVGGFCSTYAEQQRGQ